MKVGISAGGLAAIGALVSALSCRGGPQLAAPDTLPAGAAASATVGASTSTPAVTPAPTGRNPTLTVLAAPKSVSLAAEVRPVASRRSALVTHHDLLAGYSYVRYIDGQHKLGKLRALPGRRPVTVLDGPKPLLVTSRGRDLCLERLDVASKPMCHRARADFALLLDGQPVLLEQREEVIDKAKPAPPKPKSKRRRRSPPKARKKPKVQKPTSMRLWVQRLDGDGNKRGPGIDSGLRVLMPLPGMGVIAAASTASGIRVIHYQHDKPRSDGRRWVKQAKLMSALLGKDGKLIGGTAREIYRGDRAYGHIEGHREPRLFGSSVLVGRHVDKQVTPVQTRWEARRLGPVRTVPAPNAVLGVDPWRLKNKAVVGAAELAALTAIYDAAPRLAVGQPSSDAGRVAWVGGRGFFLKDGKLSSASRSDGAVRAEPTPFIAKRSRISWATLSSDGNGLAQTSDGLVEIHANGTTAVSSGVAQAPLSDPVRIGNDWWAVVASGKTASGGAVVRLSSSPVEATALTPHAYADGHALAGGAEHGHFVSLHGRRLTSWRLGKDGAALELATVPSAMGTGIRGVARRGGGVILVGRQPLTGVPTAMALDARGQIVGEDSFTLKSRGSLTIVAMPRGAVVLDEQQTRIVWLDDNAHSLGTADWPRSSPAIACVDGVAARDMVPSATPGQLDPIGHLAGDHCWALPFPVRMADGSHRWLGSAVEGMHAKAVLASLPATGPPSKAATPASKSPPSPARPTPATSRCAADMVSIAGRYCIDRFETQLVDAGSGRPLSPDYPSTPGILKSIFRAYAAGRWNMGDLRAQAMPLPPLLRLPSSAPSPASRSRYDVRPSGYLTWHVAKKACTAVGKRLCTQTEWVTACRGQQDRLFPYGDNFAHNKCNVWRFAHPAAALHGNASIGHLDPRLNRVLEGDRPLLRRTGVTTSCASRWGDDAVFDMVGNLDEWFDHKKGAFAGGFYSRTTKKGCDAVISAHPKRYLDYSLGTRCCSATR